MSSDPGSTAPRSTQRFAADRDTFDGEGLEQPIPPDSLRPYDLNVELKNSFMPPPPRWRQTRSVQVFRQVALGFVMFLVLWRLRKHTHADGWLFGVYAVLAGIERFLVEFLRIKDDRFFVLSIAQCIAIAVFVVGILVMRARSGPAARPGPNAIAAGRASAPATA